MHPPTAQRKIRNQQLRRIMLKAWQTSRQAKGWHFATPERKREIFAASLAKAWAWWKNYRTQRRFAREQTQIPIF